MGVWGFPNFIQFARMTLFGLFSLLLVCVFFSGLCFKNGDDSSFRFVCVIDAGSTGSRVYVYSYKENVPLASLREVGQKRIRPALSSFVEDKDGLSKHLQDLLQAAYLLVPANEHSRTPVSLMATAGMRRIPKSSQFLLMEAVHMYLDSSAFLHPSISSSRRSGVISGQAEATYDFLAVNAAFQVTRDKGRGKGYQFSIGVADLGSSSTQYACICSSSSVLLDNPSGEEISASSCGDVHVETNLNSGVALSLHARSATGLGLIEGMESLIRRYERERLVHSCAHSLSGDEFTDEASCVEARKGTNVWGLPTEDDETLPSWAIERTNRGNPCLASDAISVQSADGSNFRSVHGSGDFDACVRLIQTYLVPQAQKALCSNYKGTDYNKKNCKDEGVGGEEQVSADVAMFDLGAEGSMTYIIPNVDQNVSSGPHRHSCTRLESRPRYVIGLDNYPKIMEVLGLHTVKSSQKALGKILSGEAKGAMVKEEQDKGSNEFDHLDAALKSLALSPDDIARAGRLACAQTWTQLLDSLSPGEPAYRAQRACYGSAFTYALLTSVYDVPHDAADFVPLEFVETYGELGWPLGAALTLAMSDSM